MKVFGPVPSRRLGRSLGINNIPPKICNYNCIYCQLGRSTHMTHERSFFYSLSELEHEVKEKLIQLQLHQEKVDYLTFVADGEPTLDRNLGNEIRAFQRFGIKIAIITNSAFLAQLEMRNELNLADWVSLKIDAISLDTWKKINRPLGALNLYEILHGIELFSRSYKGALTTQTMLVQGVNDQTDEIEKIADFIASIHPQKAYLSIPTRPPAESYVQPPDEHIINTAYNIWLQRNIPVELLIGYEGDEFTTTGNAQEEILNITSVHPMKISAVQMILEKYGVSWEIMDTLIKSGKIVANEFRGNRFYLRNLKKFQT